MENQHIVVVVVVVVVVILHFDLKSLCLWLISFINYIHIHISISISSFILNCICMGTCSLVCISIVCMCLNLCKTVNLLLILHTNGHRSFTHTHIRSENFETSSTSQSCTYDIDTYTFHWRFSSWIEVSWFVTHEKEEIPRFTTKSITEIFTKQWL